MIKYPVIFLRASLSQKFISISVNRYMNHHQSFNLEKTLNSMVTNKMEEMMKHNMSWIDVQFLKKSLDTLFECRRTLMYTYAFAHYLKKNNHSTMFEVILIFHNQRIYSIQELQWHQEPPCSSWDTGRVVPFIFSPGVKSLN